MKFTDLLYEIIVEEFKLNKKRHLKTAIEIATQLANRGYDPIEAVEFAADSVRMVDGFHLSPEDKKNILHFIPVHKNFQEETKIDNQ